MQIRADIVEWREVEGEVVILDLRNNTYLAINRTGAEIWPALVSGADREEFVRRITQAFAVSEEQAAADLDAFLGQLSGQNLLEPE